MKGEIQMSLGPLTSEEWGGIYASIALTVGFFLLAGIACLVYGIYSIITDNSSTAAVFLVLGIALIGIAATLWRKIR